ncbi:MAG: glycosyltransferase family 4 protein [Lapillicoccus sp.]
MRIAFVSDNYPRQGEAGGIGTYTRVMARCLGRQGHEVHIFAGGGTGLVATGGLSLHLVPPVGDREAVGNAVLRAVETGGPFDVLEAPEFRALGAVAVGRRDVARLLTVRLHGAETLLGHRPDMWKGLPEDPERAVACAADLVTAPSAAAVEMTDAHWGTRLRSRVVVVPNPGPDVVSLPSTRPRYDVAFFGRLEPRKGVDVLADVLRRVSRPLSLVVAGSDHPWGEGKTGLDLLRSSGARVSYLGVLDHAQVMATLSQARIAVVPSRNESFGLTLLEAMTARVPAVASDIPAFRELIGDSCGVPLLPLDAPALWAAEITRLLDDPQLASDRVRRAGVRAQAFRPPAVAKALLTAWSSRGRLGSSAC